MHPEHARLRAELEALSPPPDRGPPANYLGQGSHPLLGVSVPEKRALARAWASARKGAPAAEVLPVVESLFAGETYDEKTLAPLILSQHRAARLAVRPQDVHRWLADLVGWAEVDHLCQGLFPAEQLLADWPAWRPMIARLAGDATISRRRAALVLLTAPVRRSPDPRLKDLAFANLEILQRERDILITKAVSWLLRSLVTHHPEAVAAWLQAYDAELPAIARREVRAKLDTGRKTSRAPA
ncbi:DNA alkylation repair protein [Phenylobacterium sp.]|jgi:3-methyladenine DNA glycosylase AlkD|uniref:DNA alkylation repair protein n=1 Tax=Phenylobacterium sp. TaxID=1871053 RepID=UPI002F9314DB